MHRTLCKSKIVNAVITEKLLKYSGSIGIDESILMASDILIGEEVHVLNVNNGERFSTYAIGEKPYSGKIVLYGPGARKGEVGDELIILSYCLMEGKESRDHKLRMITLSKNNKLKSKK